MSADLMIKELDDRYKLIKHTVAKNLSDNEFLLFANIAKSRGLDILLNQIYAVKRKNKDGTHQITYQIGIDGYRLIAARTGEYAGSDEALFEYDNEGKPIKSTSTVYRMVGGQKCSFTASARWTEYYPGDSMGFMWRKLPETMLSKVSEGKALRKGFPNELGGFYIDEEMQQAEKDVTQSTRAKELTARFEQEPKPDKPEYKEPESEKKDPVDTNS